MMRKSDTPGRAWAAALALGALMASAGCGGGGGDAPSPPPVSVAVSPSSIPLTLGQTQPFSAVLFNSANTTVTWSVAPGGAGGRIDPGSGLYTAPAALTKSATDTVVATSAADPTRSATATVTVTVGGAAVTVSARPGGRR